ncbi:UNVERIFIED_CONTAM: hypothetical protein FKN15_022501 [Acipenser sinensis]
MPERNTNSADNVFMISLCLGLALLIVSVSGKCGNPPEYPNTVMTTQLPPDLVEGSTITYACQSGYVRKSGSTTSTCTNSQWSQLTLECERRSCGSPGEILNGRFNTDEGVLFGDKAYAVCDEGSTLLYQTQCEIKYPTCMTPGSDPGECDYPPEYQTALMKDEHLTQGPSDFVEGFTIAYRCQSGYVQKAGSPRITCTNSQWSDLTLVCDRRSCGSPGEILNGHFNTDEGVLFGDKAYAVCDEGFQMAGNGVRSCRAAGWDGTIPICEIVKCPDPTEIVNGEITNAPQGTVTFGTSIIYKCNEGILVGNRELVCTKYGNYSSVPPACKDHKGCRSVQVENGYKVAGFGPVYSYEDFITFACNSGYILNGTDTVTCGINEIWEPQLPTCEIGRSCGSPGEILNGRFNTDEGVRFGDKAYAVCDEGFQLAGNGVRNCLATGWDGAIPICERFIYVILGLLIPVAVAVAVAVGFWFFKNRKGKSSSPPGTAAVY